MTYFVVVPLQDVVVHCSIVGRHYPILVEPCLQAVDLQGLLEADYKPPEQPHNYSVNIQITQNWDAEQQTSNCLVFILQGKGMGGGTACSAGTAARGFWNTTYWDHLDQLDNVVGRHFPSLEVLGIVSTLLGHC